MSGACELELYSHADEIGAQKSDSFFNMRAKDGFHTFMKKRKN